MNGLSARGLEVLRDIAEGRGIGHNCRRRLQHGASGQVVGAVYRRDLIDKPAHGAQLTVKGRALLALTFGESTR